MLKGKRRLSQKSNNTSSRSKYSCLKKLPIVLLEKLVIKPNNSISCSKKSEIIQDGITNCDIKQQDINKDVTYKKLRNKVIKVKQTKKTEITFSKVEKENKNKTDIILPSPDKNKELFIEKLSNKSEIKICTKEDSHVSNKLNSLGNNVINQINNVTECKKPKGKRKSKKGFRGVPRHLLISASKPNNIEEENVTANDKDKPMEVENQNEIETFVENKIVDEQNVICQSEANQKISTNSIVNEICKSALICNSESLPQLQSAIEINETEFDEVVSNNNEPSSQLQSSSELRKPESNKEALKDDEPSIQFQSNAEISESESNEDAIHNDKLSTQLQSSSEIKKSESNEIILHDKAPSIQLQSNTEILESELNEQILHNDKTSTQLQSSIEINKSESANKVKDCIPTENITSIIVNLNENIEDADKGCKETNIINTYHNENKNLPEIQEKKIETSNINYKEIFVGATEEHTHVDNVENTILEECLTENNEELNDENEIEDSQTESNSKQTDHSTSNNEKDQDHDTVLEKSLTKNNKELNYENEKENNQSESCLKQIDHLISIDERDLDEEEENPSNMEIDINEDSMQFPLDKSESKLIESNAANEIQILKNRDELCASKTSDNEIIDLDSNLRTKKETSNHNIEVDETENGCSSECKLVKKFLPDACSITELENTNSNDFDTISRNTETPNSDFEMADVSSSSINNKEDVKSDIESDEADTNEVLDEDCKNIDCTKEISDDLVKSDYSDDEAEYMEKNCVIIDQDSINVYSLSPASHSTEQNEHIKEEEEDPLQISDDCTNVESLINLVDINQLGDSKKFICCPKCNTRYPVFHFKEHLILCYSALQLPCDFCEVKCKSERKLVNHLKKFHNDVVPEAEAEKIAAAACEKSGAMKTVKRSKRVSKVKLDIPLPDFVRVYCKSCLTTHETIPPTYRKICDHCYHVLTFHCNRCHKHHLTSIQVARHLRAECSLEPDGQLDCSDCRYVTSRPLKSLPQPPLPKLKQLQRNHAAKQIQRKKALKLLELEQADEEWLPNKSMRQLDDKIDRQEQSISNLKNDEIDRQLQCNKTISKSQNNKIDRRLQCNKSISNLQHNQVNKQICQKIKKETIEPNTSTQQFQDDQTKKPTSRKIKKEAYESFISTSSNHMCNRCGKSFGAHVSLKKHQLYCGRKANMSCKFCSFKTKHISAIKTHIQRHVLNNDQPLQEHNKEKSLNETDIKDSERKAHGKNIEQMVEIRCSSCNKLNQSSSRTLDVCSDCNVTEQFVCSICQQNGPSHFQLYNHVARLHAPKIFSCNKCTRSFSYEPDYLLHERELCSKPIIHQCKLCTYRSPMIKALKDHMSRRHPKNNQSSFVCSRCGQRYLLYASYQRHIRLCGKIPPLSCDHCNYKTNSKYSLTRHIQSVHAHQLFSTLFKCRSCYQAYTNYYIYEKHIEKCPFKFKR